MGNQILVVPDLAVQVAFQVSGGAWAGLVGLALILATAYVLGKVVER